MGAGWSAEGAAGDSTRRPARGPVGELRAGVSLPFEGFRLVRSERALRRLSLVPFALSIVALTAAAVLVYQLAGDIDAAIAGWLPVFEAEAWYAWLWVGPAKAFFWLLGLALFLVTIAFAAVLALMLATIASAPFLDSLSYRAEQIVRGAVLESAESGVGAVVRDAGRSIAGEARRMTFFLAIWIALFGAGFLVPGAHLVTGPMMVGVTILFLPLEYAGYTLDRRQVPFGARRRWIGANWPRMVGFGGAAFVLCLIPGLNLLVIPTLVVAGTLLVLRSPPSEVGRSVASAGEPEPR